MPESAAAHEAMYVSEVFSTASNLVLIIAVPFATNANLRFYVCQLKSAIKYTATY
jgi:hypothetical protein